MMVVVVVVVVVAVAVAVAFFFIGEAIFFSFLLLCRFPLTSIDMDLVGGTRKNETTDVLPSSEPYRRILVISISV